MVHEKYNIGLLKTLSVPVLNASRVEVRDEHKEKLVDIHESHELNLWIVGPVDNYPSDGYDSQVLKHHR